MDIKKYINTKVLNNNLESNWELVPFKTKRMIFKKNEVITQFGQVERRAYFLIDGIIESSILKDGEIKIIDFVFSNNFICSYTSFLLQTYSEIQTTAITDCEVEYFNKDDIELAYQTSLLANQFGRHITEYFLLKKLRREREFLTKSAKERYMNLILESPEVIKWIPINKIAKYLGIHPESLSRIRSEIIS
jgi:CRP-like cAMP-binding protein